MTVVEVKQKKIKLQEDINKLCDEFQKETCVAINDIRGDFRIDTMGQRFPRPNVNVIVFL